MANTVPNIYSKADVAAYAGSYFAEGLLVDWPTFVPVATLAPSIFFLGGDTTPPPTPSPRPASGQMWPRGSN